MIVKCANCQTRFKIGDDKVTEKGVKVRCTKCSTIFTVRKDGGEASAPAPDKSKGTNLGPTKAARVSATPLSDLLGADLLAKPLPAMGAPPPPPPPGAVDDPFSMFAGIASPPSMNGAGLMPGEFALSGDAPSPELAAAPRAATSQAATSEEDLLGLDTGWRAAPSPGLGASADPFDAALDPLGGSQPNPPPSPDPFGTLPADPFGDPPPATPQAAPPPTVASFGAEFDAGSFDPLAGLSLDPAAIPGAESPGVITDRDASADLFDLPQRPPPADLSLGSTAARDLPSPSLQSTSGTVELARIGVVKERLRPPEQQRELPEDRPLANRVFSALTGAAMVVLLLLGFVAYRNGGRLDLRDPLSAVFNAFGFSRPVPASLSLPTQILSSGFYPTLRGAPVLFVRGTVKNLTSSTTHVALKLDVIVDGHVVATAEGEPGVLPTPEDLYALNGTADVRALHERLVTVPAAPVAPGRSAEFVLVTGDLPDGVRLGTDRAELVVSARASSTAAPGDQRAPLPMGSKPSAGAQAASPVAPPAPFPVR